MKKSLGKNFIFDVSYRIVNVIAPLITAPYISRVIGSEGVGYHSVAQSLTGYFTAFAALGIVTYGQREIAYCGEDRGKRSQLFWEIFILRLIITAIVAMIYCFFIQTKDGIIKSLLLIQAIDFVGGITDITWLYQGTENFLTLAIRNILMRLLGIVCILIFVKEETDLYKYAFIVCISTVVSNFSMLVGLKQYVGKPQLRNLEIFRHLKPTLRLFVPTITLTVYSLIDKTMLWDITSTASANGYYEQATKIVTILITLVCAIGNVAAPRTAKLFADGDKKGIESITIKSILFTLFLSIPIVFGVTVISADFVLWFFGNEYQAVGPLLSILSIVCVPMSVKYVIGNQYLVSTKKEKTYIMSLLFGLLVNIIFNAILIPQYQAMGAVVASIISEFSIAFFQLISLRRDIKLKAVSKQLGQFLLSGIIMFLAIGFWKLNVSNILMEILIKMIIGAIVYCGCLWILKNETLIALKNRFFHIRVR